jgi:HK97 gp10 family phage protein
MPVEIKLEIKNLDKLVNAMQRFPKEAGAALREASMRGALMVEGQAKRLTPVDTGRLRSSIASSLGVLDHGLSSIVSTNVVYAVYVHEGTKRMRPRPFMREAANMKSKDIEMEFTRSIENVLSKVL